MNHILKTSILVCIVIFAGSFTSRPGENIGNYKTEGRFTARIDGRAFESHNYTQYTAEVVNKSDATASASSDITFFGSDRFDQNGKAFRESLEFKYAFNESAIGAVAQQQIIFQFNNQKFMSVPGQTKIRVTKMHFNAERTAFVMSADFEGKMLQCAASGQSQAIVKVKGTMEDIHVSVPSISSPKTAPQATAE